MKMMRKGPGEREADPSLLARTIFAETGRKLLPSHSAKAECRYGCHRSTPPDERKGHFSNRRLPAKEIAQRAKDIIEVMLQDQAAMTTALAAAWRMRISSSFQSECR
jgi:hypothetical protein